MRSRCSAAASHQELAYTSATCAVLKEGVQIVVSSILTRCTKSVWLDASGLALEAATSKKSCAGDSHFFHLPQHLNGIAHGEQAGFPTSSPSTFTCESVGRQPEIL